MARRALMFSYGVLHEVDLATGTTRVLRVDDQCRNCRFVDDARFIGGYRGRVFLYRLDASDGGATLLDSAKVPSDLGAYCVALRERFVVVDGEKTSLVFAVHDDKLLKIGKLPGLFPASYEDRGDIVLVSSAAVGGVASIENLDAALAREIAANAKRKTKAPRRRNDAG